MTKSLFLAAGLSALVACGKPDQVGTAGSSGDSSGSGRTESTWSGPGTNASATFPVDTQSKQTRSGRETRITTNSHSGISPEGQSTPASGGALATAPGALADRDADTALADRIRVAISTGSTGTTGVIPEESLADIQVGVTNGVVTLAGSVGTEGERKRLEGLVKGMVGDKTVNNQLTVGQPSTTRENAYPVPKHGGPPPTAPQPPTPPPQE